MTTANDLDLFTRSYVVCALWSSTDLEGIPLDRDYNIEDISEQAMGIIQTECKQFQIDNADDIGNYVEQAGHDFWLTRNGHGAGFWESDRPWDDDVRDRLTQAAHAYKNIDLYPGDDGKLYI